MCVKPSLPNLPAAELSSLPFELNSHSTLRILFQRSVISPDIHATLWASLTDGRNVWIVSRLAGERSLPPPLVIVKILIVHASECLHVLLFERAFVAMQRLERHGSRTFAQPLSLQSVQHQLTFQSTRQRQRRSSDRPSVS